MQRLIARLLHYRTTVTAGVVVSLAITVTGLAKPWPTKILVDDVLGRQHLGNLSHTSALTVAVAGTVLLFLLSGGLGLLQTRLLFGLSQRMIQDLRAELFGHLTRLSLRYHDTAGTGDSLYRVTTDTYAVQSVLLDGIVPLTTAVLALVGTLVVMLRLDPVLALLAVVSAPAAAVVSNRFGGRIRSMSLDVHRRESDVYAHAERTLGGMRTVQAFGRESYELERFRRQADGSRSAMLRLVTEQTVFGLVIDLVLALGMALVTYVAARRSLDGHLTTGEVLVFLAYAGSLYGPVAGLASVFSELQAAAAGAQRVFEVLDAAQVPDRPKALAPSPRALGVIRFEDVTFAYHDQHPVLHGVSFDAAPGETVALVGPTGAGKSTIASLLLRLYDVDEGQVQLDGNDVRGVPLGWLRGQIALVPQDPVLFPDTILENIRYGRLDASDSEVEEAAYEANLLDEIRRMPQQMHTPVGDRGVMLSGGQRQRVAIARAILRDAPVVVLDEPTSALDAGTEVQVMTAIDRLVAGRTCLVIAHRLATVRGADRVLVVADGRIVQQGTHRSLVRRNGLYRELHAARFGVAA